MKSSTQNTRRSPPACPACGDCLPPDAQFCPGCGRPVKPLKGPESGIAPRTDKPLSAAPGVTETRTDCDEIVQYLPQRYKPVKKIGQGGMGTVYLCQDQALERPVAIKIMTDRYRADPQGERRFMREARAQAIVNHPNVATVLNFGVSPEGRPYLVMEYLEGEDLRAVIRQEKAIEPLRACDLLRQVCDGLNEAHISGLVHRDLKPSNIMIVRDHRGAPWVKILDLGLAKIVGGQSDLKSITMDTAGLLVGTPAYMSPEQVAGSSVDGRADLYSLGIVFFEMLTGRLPFESETMEGWLYQHLHAQPPPPSHFMASLAATPALDKLTLWMIAKSPGDRPANAGELAAILRHLIERNLVEDTAAAKPARRSGPRPALPFEAHPPPRRSAQPAPDPAVALAEQRRSNCRQYAKVAEKAESERRWQDALDNWQSALALADHPEEFNPHVQNCRRHMEVDELLAQATQAAGAGEWEETEKCLARLGSARSDSRVELFRARLPQFLSASWMALARGKILGFPEGDLRQTLLERAGIAYAQTGDMPSALAILQDSTRKVEARVVGLAQGIAAAIQCGHHEGLRPFLEQASTSAANLADPSERGRAQLETGRALSAYGDQAAAAAAFSGALAAFSEANGRGIPMQAAIKRASVRRGIDMRSVALTSTHLTGAKAVRASFEAAIGVVAQAQAEAGLVDDSMASTALIEDAWTLAQSLSQVAQAFAKTGRIQDAERVTARIGFALAKTQALRAMAVSRIYSGDMAAAEEILKNIPSAADRIALHGLLAAAWALRKDNGRAEFRVTEAIKSIADVTGARARFQALLSAAEPLLNAGFQDFAQPIIAEAHKLIDLVDDSAERLRSMLQLAHVEEGGRNTHQSTTRTMVAARLPSPAFVEALAKAMVIWRQVRHGVERMECVERLGHSVAWGYAPHLASELLRSCREEGETALGYIGLSTGMAV